MGEALGGGRAYDLVVLRNEQAVRNEAAGRLLADQELAGRLGATARRRVGEGFAMKDFVRRQRGLLAEARVRSEP